MKDRSIGKLPARYVFLLNPYRDLRLSKCPECRRATHPRKFPLLIHIDGYGPFVLGKTCRYCTRCELIIAHQDELEGELVQCFERIDPDAIGRDYLVLGTVDKKHWKEGLGRRVHSLDDTLDYTAAFKRYLNLEITGGWGLAE